MQQHRPRWKFTRNAAAFGCLLVAIWYSASSEQNAAAYVLLFALTAIGLVSLPHAIANVRGLTGRAEAIKPTFAGQEVALPIEIVNQLGTCRGIRARIDEDAEHYEQLGEIASGKSARATLRFSAPERGEHQITRFCLETTYPIGLLKVVKPIAVSQRYIVYPNPAGDSTLPLGGRSDSQETVQSAAGEGDDFAGVRAYVPGESQRHIDWKAVARGQGMMTKQFAAEPESSDFYLDFAAVRSRHLEERLSQLALWVIEAERSHRRYGLRLPNLEIKPSLGDAHFHRCLRTLALFK